MNPCRYDLSAALSFWARISQRNAVLVLLTISVLTLAALAYTAKNLSIDTNTAHLISAALPWRQAEEELDRLFPQLSNTLVVVIESDTPELAQDAAWRLSAELSGRNDLYTEVFSLETDPFFRRSAFLYLSMDELRSVLGDLSRAQPFLGALQHDLSLHGVFNLLSRALQRPQETSEIVQALPEITRAVAAVNEHRFYRLSWQKLTGAAPAAAAAGLRFIEIAPRFDFHAWLPAGKAIDHVRESAKRLQLTPDRGVTVRLTGSVAMEHEELLSAVKGAVLALGAAVLTVLVLLYLTLRAWPLIVATLVALLAGLIATAAFATLAVGHLNLISIAFGVLYVGLGIDYALYLAMEYRALLGRNGGSSVATEAMMPLAAAHVGGYMLVCVVTISMGFLAFVPTSFVAIRELGEIAAGGMVISFIMSLTILPAMIAVWPPTRERAKLDLSAGGAFWNALERIQGRSSTVLTIGIILVCTSLWFAPKIRFDPDPLNLRDPASESVATFRRLLSDPNVPTLTLSALAANAAAATQLAARLSALPLVLRAMTVRDFVPDRQPQKLAMLDDAATVLGPDLIDGPVPAVAANDLDYASLVQLRTQLDASVNSHPFGSAQGSVAERSRSAAQVEEGASSARALALELKRFESLIESQDSQARARLLAVLRTTLLGVLPSLFLSLQQGMQASAVSIHDLPTALVRRWVSDTGVYRVEAAPREVLATEEAMQRFVTQLREVAPQAVGPPVVSLESGRAVVQAFQQAFLLALIAIAVLLMLLLRSTVDAALAMLPLALAGLMTIAVLAAFDIPFNFANIIALPLILGVGIDYGVYIVQRARKAGPAGLFRSGAARAVLAGGLITVASFGDLVVSQHPGTASLGLVLSLGLGLTLLCALVFLVSALQWRSTRRKSRSAVI